MVGLVIRILLFNCRLSSVSKKIKDKTSRTDEAFNTFTESICYLFLSIDAHCIYPVCRVSLHDYVHIIQLRGLFQGSFLGHSGLTWPDLIGSREMYGWQGKRKWVSSHLHNRLVMYTDPILDAHGCPTTISVVSVDATSEEDSVRISQMEK